jgi:hypothetical protein
MTPHKRAYTALQDAFLYNKKPDPGPMGRPNPGDGSWNIGLMNAAARYVWSQTPASRNWILAHADIYRTFGFMGKEVFSPRYRRWIMAAWLAIWRTAVDKDDHDVEVEADWVLMTYFGCMSMTAIRPPTKPNDSVFLFPGIALCGARGFKGGQGDAVDVRMLAMAIAKDPWRWADGEVFKVMRKPWMWPAEIMKRSEYRLPGYYADLCEQVMGFGSHFEPTEAAASRLWNELPEFKTVVPFTFFRDAGGLELGGSVMHINCNGNTPPLMGAAVWCRNWQESTSIHGMVAETRAIQPHGTKRPTRGGRGEADLYDKGGMLELAGESTLGREGVVLPFNYSQIVRWRTRT